MQLIPMLEKKIGRNMENSEKNWVRQMLDAGNEQVVNEWITEQAKDYLTRLIHEQRKLAQRLRTIEEELESYESHA